MEKPVQFCEGFYFPAGNSSTSYINLQIQNHVLYVKRPSYSNAYMHYNGSRTNLFVEFKRPESSANVDVNLIIFVCNDMYSSGQKLKKNFTFPKGENSIQVELQECIFRSNAYSVTGMVSVSFPDSCKNDWKKSNVRRTSSSDVISSQLSKDLACLLDSDVSSDYVLRCAGQEFPVHKCILAARSSVFAAMFRFYKNAEAEVPMTKVETWSNKKEKPATRASCKKRKNSQDCTQETFTTSNQAEDIMDIKPEILKKMLKYIYSGQIDDLTSTEAGDLLYAADKYQLDLLKKMCIDKLKSTLSANNVLDMLVIGNLHDESLKANAMNFICKYTSLSELEKMDQWKSLQTTNPAMVIEVLTSVVGYLQDSKK